MLKNSEVLMNLSSAQIVRKLSLVLARRVATPASSGATLAQDIVLEECEAELKRRGWSSEMIHRVRSSRWNRHLRQADRIPQRAAAEVSRPPVLATRRTLSELRRQGWHSSVLRQISTLLRQRDNTALTKTPPAPLAEAGGHWRSLPRYAEYSFRPVGQGLFSSGRVAIGSGRACFTWVYDCGSAHRQHHVDREVDLTISGLGTRARLDLLVLSHFDKDHISGLVRLLGKVSVGTLLLPLVPLWQRLALLFESRSRPVGFALRYLLDPVSALRSLEQAQIGQIVLVPSSRGDRDGDFGPAPPNAEPPRDSADEGPLRNPSVADEASGISLPRGTREITDAAAGKLYQLPVGGALTFGHAWEFVPYNDVRSVTPTDQPFVDHAQLLGNELLQAHDEAGRRRALKSLKRHYEARYRDARARNAISLFLYTGACATVPSRHRWRQGQRSSLVLRSAALYCGDGYLDTREKWECLATYLGPGRVASLLAFQVMHHGASANWHPGLAGQVDATYAVFCANPEHRYRHPHDAVVTDFARHSVPCLVNDRRLTLASFW